MNIMMTSKQQNKTWEILNMCTFPLKAHSMRKLNNMCKAISSDKKIKCLSLRNKQRSVKWISSGTSVCTETISAMILSHEIFSFIPDDILQNPTAETRLTLRRARPMQCFITRQPSHLMTNTHKQRDCITTNTPLNSSLHR